MLRGLFFFRDLCLEGRNSAQVASRRRFFVTSWGWGCFGLSRCIEYGVAAPKAWGLLFLKHAFFVCGGTGCSTAKKGRERDRIQVWTEDRKKWEKKKMGRQILIPSNHPKKLILIILYNTNFLYLTKWKQWMNQRKIRISIEWRSRCVQNN